VKTDVAKRDRDRRPVRHHALHVGLDLQALQRRGEREDEREVRGHMVRGRVVARAKRFDALDAFELREPRDGEARQRRARVAQCRGHGLGSL